MKVLYQYMMILFSNKNTIFVYRQKKFERISVLRFISCFFMLYYISDPQPVVVLDINSRGSWGKGTQN